MSQEGLGFMFLQLGQRGKGRIAVPNRRLRSCLTKFGISLFSWVFPPAANNKVQELLGEVWDKAPSRSRRPRRKGCSSAAKWSLKGTQRAVGSLRDCGLSLQTHPQGIQPSSPCRTSLPGSCDNLPWLRKTAGNLILLPALPSLFVLKKRYCQPRGSKGCRCFT